MLQESMAGLLDGGVDHEIDEGGGGLRRFVLVIDGCHGGADDVAGLEFAPLDGQFIAAAGTTDTAKNPCSYKGLQHGLEMTGRKVMALGKGLGRDGCDPPVNGNIDHCCDAEKTAS